MNACRDSRSNVSSEPIRVLRRPLHDNGWVASVLKGGRAEFFSMITVMVGMGLVMYYVTPSVVGEESLPSTYAFWTFGSLGLLVGFVFTYSMNWWLVSIGWKHGEGHEHMLKQMDKKKRQSHGTEAEA